jgi:hypothetical protein
MSNIDHVMKASTQAGHDAKPIEKFGGGFNAASPPSKSDPADGELEMPCSTVTGFAAKPAPPAGRRPLFRR